MSSTPSRSSRPVSNEPTTPETSDADLLGCFLHAHDHAAFELLVRRHGVMVMGLLRRMGLQQADADDAFQATFLTLVRKAGAIGRREALPGWLYKVAYRIGLEQRDRAKKRQAREHALTGSEPAPVDKEAAAFWSLVDAEVIALPEKYRVPFVLCQLQGMPIEKAARQIGCPPGTVGTRLSRAKQLLRSRLARRGMVLTAALLATYLSQMPVHAAPSAGVLHHTLQTALQFRNGAPAAAIPPTILALSDSALRALFLAKVKLAAILGGLVLAVILAAAAATPFLLDAANPDETPDESWLAQWGTVVDPDGDSRFLATRTRLKMVVQARPQLFSGPGRQNAPRIVREVQGDFLLQVRVSVAAPHRAAANFERDLFPAPGKAATLNAAAFHGAGVVVIRNDKNAALLAQGSVQSDGPRPFLLWQSRIQDDENSGERILPDGVLFPYLRVQRFGPHLFASASPDGETWGNFTAVTGDFGGAVRVGLIATHNTSEGFEATFDRYRLDRFHYGNNPRPWKGPKAPVGCVRCHAQGEPEANPEIQFRWPPLLAMPRKE